MANPIASAAKSLLGSALQIVLPKGKPAEAGTAVTNTYNASAVDQVLGAPDYRSHLKNLFDTRQAENSQDLMRELFKQDPDVSAAVFAYLTVADTQPVFLVKTPDGQLDPAGQQTLQNLLTVLTTRMDYSTGFLRKPSMRAICEELRYMLLLRGGIAAELVVNKEFFPTELRQVDTATLEWKEPSPGRYVPEQKPAGGGNNISLDIPTFFVSFFRRDPTNIYTESTFVSAINTIAARQQVINDLYRIMQMTGYPRMEVTVLEEVILKNCPADIKTDEAKKTRYVNTVIAQIQAAVTSLRPDQAFVHTDSVQPGIMNERAPGMAIDINSVIGVLNAQNQAALKTMATVIGRGESGVNTASVEARVFSMNAEAVNGPIAELLSGLLTLGLRFHGSLSMVECYFRPVEMRSDLELEPQYTMRASRLMTDLSLGLITDAEYTLEMYGRLPLPGATPLSGTGFMQSNPASVDTEKVSPNSDPLGRSIAPEGGTKAARSGATKKPQQKPR